MDTMTLRRGLSQAAWGFFFLTFDLRIGPVNLLPRFAGSLLFLLAIRSLSGVRRDLAGLRPLAVLLAFWEGGQGLASLVGASLEGHLVFVDLVITAADLYFRFQFLTDLAVLADAMQGPEENLAGRLRTLRTVDLLLATALALALQVPALAPAVRLGALLPGIAIQVLLVITLFQLRARVPVQEGTGQIL